MELSPVCPSACRRETKALQCVSCGHSLLLGGGGTSSHRRGWLWRFRRRHDTLPLRRLSHPSTSKPLAATQQHYGGGYCFEGCDQLWWRGGARKSNLAPLTVRVLRVFSSDITYSILFEAVTTLLVLFSYQLFHKDILRDGLIYQHIMKGRWWEKKHKSGPALKSACNFVHQLNHMAEQSFLLFQWNVWQCNSASAFSPQAVYTSIPVSSI